MTPTISTNFSCELSDKKKEGPEIILCNSVSYLLLSSFLANKVCE